MLETITDPIFVASVFTAFGVVLNRNIWPWLEAKVLKTENKIDDKVLEVIKTTVKEALEATKKKKTK